MFQYSFELFSSNLEDLNPIRAAIAETIESSDYTSAQRRVQALPEQENALQKQATTVVVEDLSQATAPLKDGILSTLSVDERNAPVGPHAGNPKVIDEGGAK